MYLIDIVQARHSYGNCLVGISTMASEMNGFIT